MNANWSVAETSARHDLAAAYRLAAAYGWTNIIYSHISLRHPEEPEVFLFKPHDVMFEEVTASGLMKMDLRGNVLAPNGAAANPGFTIHADIMKARSDVNCVVHVHTDEGMAVSAQADGLLPFSQDAMHFYNRLAYHDYGGLATGSDGERNRLASDLGSNRAMILRNHGLLTCGESLAMAVILMKYLTSCCKSQLMLQASGVRLNIPPPAACEAAAAQWDGYYRKSTLQAEWGTLTRWMDRLDKGYRQ